jgi:hypothetical protein
MPKIKQLSNNELPLFEINIVVSQKNNLPIIELRKNTCNEEIIKKIVFCALNEQPIIIMPKFKDKLKSLGSLIEKGVMSYDTENNEYYFNI